MVLEDGVIGGETVSSTVAFVWLTDSFDEHKPVVFVG